MGEVTTSGKRHPENRIARLQKRQEHRLIGLCTGMRLDIDECRAEQLLCAFDGKRFGNIDEFAPAIVAAPGVTLGIFVRQYRALCLEHGVADNVLRCDHLDLILLTDKLMPDSGCKLGVGIRQRSGEEAVHHRIFSDVIHIYLPERPAAPPIYDER